MVLKVGLTGGIGAGKSFVGGILQKKGAQLIGADEVGHTILKKPEIIKTISDYFGQSVVFSEKEKIVLNRKILREQIYNNPLQKTWLENLLQPLIRKEIIFALERVDALPRFEKPEYILIESSILHKSGFYTLCDVSIIVLAEESVRLQRVLQRDNTTLEDAQKIITLQMQDNNFLHENDFYITNNFGEKELLTQINRLHEQLKQRANKIDSK